MSECHVLLDQRRILLGKRCVILDECGILSLKNTDTVMLRGLKSGEGGNDIVTSLLNTLKNEVRALADVAAEIPDSVADLIDYKAGDLRDLLMARNT